MSYFDWKHQVLVAWSPAASAPKHKAVLARTADGETISAENLGEEWLNLGDDDEEMDAPIAWAPHPYVPEQITIKEVLTYLSGEDREMIVGCLEGETAPDHIDREFIEWGIFAPALQPMFTLGGRKDSPSGFGIRWALTEFGTALAEHIAEAEADA